MGRKNTEADFWAQVDRTGECWFWTGNKLQGSGGYGRLRFQGRQIKAHRLSLELELGYQIPSDRMVLHSCDQPACVNPAHLRLGGHLDNMRDRQERGRWAGAGSETCGRGHRWDEYAVPSKGGRKCGECERIARRERVQRKSSELKSLREGNRRLAAAVERVRALHEPEPFEMPNGATWYRCGRCQHVSDRPCATIRALDGTDE